MPMAPVGDVRIHYQVQGHGDPLLLIMGYRASSCMWGGEFLKPLARFFQVITFDNRGMGESDKPNTVYTLPMMADDAAGLLRYLGMAQAHVFGVSMGGMIAQEVALRYPRQVNRLILGCTTCGGPQAIVPPISVIETLLSAPHLPRQEAIRRQWPIMVSPAFIEQNVAFLDRMASLALMHPTPHHTAIRQMMAVQRFNTYARLGQIQASTLILTGRDDRVIPPANSYLLAHRIPRARLHVIPDAGHGFFWEKGAEVVDLLCKFCDLEFHETNIDHDPA